MISNQNSRNGLKKAKQRYIKEIKAMQEDQGQPDWFFYACLLTFPETMIVQQQIRQAIFVFQQERPQQVLVVTLNQSAVRRYCNILKPFHKYQFTNGVVKTSFLNNNFVLMNEGSKILHVQQGIIQKWHDNTSNQIKYSKDNHKIMAKNQQYKKYSVSSRLPNQSWECNYLCQEGNCKKQLYETQSERIPNQRQSPKEELVNFCGSVKGIYQVGKGRMNHGIGYRIQQFPSKAIYEVVVWCEMQCGQLKKGKTYEFKNFRIHKKHNLEISYHSHPQLSSIELLF